MTEILDLFGNNIIRKDSISREILAKQLKNNLQGMPLDVFVNLITNKFNEIIEYGNLSNGYKSCQKTSLLFNSHRLNIKTKSSKYSIFEALQLDDFFSGLARAVLFKKRKVNELLYQVLQLGINGVQYVNEFPPSVARDILLEYNMDSNSFILDPCGGWGGRMLGTSVVSNNYNCYEPCIKTACGLEKLFEFILSMNQDFNAIINSTPFEDSKLKDNFYDFAITSPPYYDTEQYSNEDTNSYNRYPNFQKWCDLFFIPLINKTMKSLKSNGVFILNIGSRIYPLNKVLMENCNKKYSIKSKGNYLSGNSGLNKSGEGEMFYEIRKKN